MSQHTVTPPFAPTGNGTVYLVMDCEGDLQRVVADLLAARYRYPLRVVAFDANDGVVRDITAEVAHKVLAFAVDLDRELPAVVRDFLGRAGA